MERSRQRGNTCQDELMSHKTKVPLKADPPTPVNPFKIFNPWDTWHQNSFAYLLPNSWPTETVRSRHTYSDFQVAWNAAREKLQFLRVQFQRICGYIFKNTTTGPLSINGLHSYHMQNTLKKCQKPYSLTAATSSPGFPHVNQVPCGWGRLSPDTLSLCRQTMWVSHPTWSFSQCQASRWLKSHEKPNPEALSQVTPEFLTPRNCESCCDKPLRFEVICNMAIITEGF